MTSRKTSSRGVSLAHMSALHYLFLAINPARVTSWGSPTCAAFPPISAAMEDFSLANNRFIGSKLPFLSLSISPISQACAYTGIVPRDLGRLLQLVIGANMAYKHS
jgi:hypothetical protein